MTVKPYLTDVRTVLTFSSSESDEKVESCGYVSWWFTCEVGDEGEVRDLDTGPAELEDHNED